MCAPIPQTWSISKHFRPRTGQARGGLGYCSGCWKWQHDRHRETRAGCLATGDRTNRPRRAERSPTTGLHCAGGWLAERHDWGETQERREARSGSLWEPIGERTFGSGRGSKGPRPATFGSTGSAIAAMPSCGLARSLLGSLRRHTRSRRCRSPGIAETRRGSTLLCCHLFGPSCRHSCRATVSGPTCAARWCTTPLRSTGTRFSRPAP